MESLVPITLVVNLLRSWGTEAVHPPRPPPIMTSPTAIASVSMNRLWFSGHRRCISRRLGGQFHSIDSGGLKSGDFPSCKTPVFEYLYETILVTK